MAKFSSPAARMKRRTLLSGGAALAGALATGCRVSTPRNFTPHILWIIAEDFSPDLGCYGNPLVATPHLDRLAAEGMRFTNAFVTAPVCSASRSALATGMYQTSIGAHHHRSHRTDAYRLPAGVRLFTHRLRDAGYHTSNLRNSHQLQGTGKTDFNFLVENPFDGEDWSERRSGQPFYAQINFPETHRRFHRFADHPVDPAQVQLPPYYPDHPAIRLDWALYLDSAQHLDRKVGRVLDRLRQEGLYEDTIVIFFSDHGQAMPRGKQFLYEDGIRIPLIIRIPERFPVDGYRAGAVHENLVSALDITATTLWLAGVPLPDGFHGRPLFGANLQPREFIIAARDRCDETVDRIRCVRDRQFKYIRNFYPERPYTQQNVYKDENYPSLRVMRDLQQAGQLTGPPARLLAPRRPPEELYDLSADPFELNNLAGQPQHAARLKRMQAVLADWMETTSDQGASPEKDLPEWDKGRSEVDGWLTKDNGRLTREGGNLRAVFRGGGEAGLARSVVEGGGEFLVEFRARSRNVRLAALRWGTIEEITHPEFRAELSFTANGEWQQGAASFQASGWLARLAFEIPDKDGEIEFDWIRLSRKQGQRMLKLREWNFA